VEDFGPFLELKKFTWYSLGGQNCA
jgi:hypothetical protein